MDIRDQLQKLFPDHQPQEDKNLQTSRIPNFYNQASNAIEKLTSRKFNIDNIGEKINKIAKINNFLIKLEDKLIL